MRRAGDRRNTIVLAAVAIVALAGGAVRWITAAPDRPRGPSVAEPSASVDTSEPSDPSAPIPLEVVATAASALPRHSTRAVRADVNGIRGSESQAQGFSIIAGHYSLEVACAAEGGAAAEGGVRASVRETNNLEHSPPTGKSIVNARLPCSNPAATVAVSFAVSTGAIVVSFEADPWTRAGVAWQVVPG